MTKFFFGYLTGLTMASMPKLMPLIMAEPRLATGLIAIAATMYWLLYVFYLTITVKK